MSEFKMTRRVIERLMQKSENFVSNEEIVQETQCEGFQI